MACRLFGGTDDGRSKGEKNRGVNLRGKKPRGGTYPPRGSEENPQFALQRVAGLRGVWPATVVSANPC
jgi:hypothetical protein